MKKVVLYVVLATIVIGIFVGVYLMVSFNISANEESVRVDFYDLKITQDDADKVNKNENWDGLDDYCWLGNEMKSDNGEYGKLFEVVYCVQLEKRFEKNDCGVSVSFDFDDEIKDNVFAYSIYPNEPFHGESSLDNKCYISLVGFSYDESEENLVEKLKNVSMCLHIQDEKDKIKDKNISFSDFNPEIVDIDKDTIENIGGTILDELGENMEENNDKSK